MYTRNKEVESIVGLEVFKLGDKRGPRTIFTSDQ